MKAFNWLSGAALLTILAATGCGSSASERSAAPPGPEETAQAANHAMQEVQSEERVRALEQQVQDLQAQIERQPSPATPPPRPRPSAPAPRAVEPAAPLAQPEPEPEPRAVHLRLEQGTELHLSLRDALSSETSAPGDPVVAVLDQDVLAGGDVALPAGSEVRGSVSEVVAQKKIGGQARLALRFDKVRTPGGYEVGIDSSTEIVGKAQKKKDAATIGGATAGGAILGRVLSKDSKTKGTVLGAAVGAAVGTAVAAKNAGDPVELEAGAPLTVALAIPVHVTVTER
jgi:hypothetical protein